MSNIGTSTMSKIGYFCIYWHKPHIIPLHTESFRLSHNLCYPRMRSVVALSRAPGGRMEPSGSWFSRGVSEWKFSPRSTLDYCYIHILCTCESQSTHTNWFPTLLFWGLRRGVMHLTFDDTSFDDTFGDLSLLTGRIFPVACIPDIPLDDTSECSEHCRAGGPWISWPCSAIGELELIFPLNSCSVCFALECVPQKACWNCKAQWSSVGRWHLLGSA